MAYFGCGESIGTHVGFVGASWVLPVTQVIASPKTTTTIVNQAGAVTSSILVAIGSHTQAIVVDVAGAVAPSRLMRFSLSSSVIDSPNQPTVLSDSASSASSASSAHVFVAPLSISIAGAHTGTVSADFNVTPFTCRSDFSIAASSLMLSPTEARPDVISSGRSIFPLVAALTSNQPLRGFPMNAAYWYFCDRINSITTIGNINVPADERNTASATYTAVVCDKILCSGNVLFSVASVNDAANRILLSRSSVVADIHISELIATDVALRLEQFLAVIDWVDSSDRQV